MQWGGAAPAAHGGGGPLGGGATEQVGRSGEHEELHVHVVHCPNGATIADLKPPVSENLENTMPCITGVCPCQQKLLLEGRGYPVWDIEMLTIVSARLAHKAMNLLP